jgi:hypothetical protein
MPPPKASANASVARRRAYDTILLVQYSLTLCFCVFLCVLRPFLIGACPPDPSRERPPRAGTAFARRHRFPPAAPMPPGPHRATPRRAARVTRRTRCRSCPHPRQYNRSPHQARCRRVLSRHLRCRGDISNAGGRRLLSVKSSRCLSAVAKRHWILARHASVWSRAQPIHAS